MKNHHKTEQRGRWPGQKTQLIGLVMLLMLLAGCQTTEPAPTQPPPPSPTPVTLATHTPRPTVTLSPTATATTAAISAVPSNTPTVTSTPRRQQSDTIPLPSPTATPTPIPGLACVTTANLNLRAGPGTGQRIIELLPGGTALQVQQRLPDNSWLQVTAPGQQVGWAAESLIRCPTDLSVLPVALVTVIEDPALTAAPAASVLAPAPTATAPPPEPTEPALPPVPQDSWRGEYYDNASLLGEPVLVRIDPDLNFNWILDSPGPGVPSDNFSVRWMGQVYFEDPGSEYAFFANADDGIRVYVDDRLVIDAWHEAEPIDYVGKFRDMQPGWHTITVEYFESGGHARVHVWADDDRFVDARWYGEYYNNRDFQGSPTFIEESGDLDFNWGHDSPDKRLSNDNFSVRWTKTVPLEYGDYEFFIEVEEDDWVRITVDGWEIIDERTDGDEEFTRGFANLGGGDHTFVVEFKDYGGKAQLEFRWNRQ